MRKRKVDCNPPPKGKRRARGEGSSEPKTVSPRERVREFPDECLTDGKRRSETFLKPLQYNNHENIIAFFQNTVLSVCVTNFAVLH